MSQHPASPDLTAFVRGTLGCGCPPEVFDRVDESPTETSLAAGISRRIDIGGRLLIYVIQVSDPGQVPLRMHDWIAAGRSEREQLGMNRLRVVLALNPACSDLTDHIEQSFARAAKDDERLHLHIVDPDRLPVS